jgi:regulator of protease activity HflC (stomatin/prohibitin superfamily)
MTSRQIGWLIISAVVLAVLLETFGTVPAGYRGVVLQFGAPTGQVKQPGLYVVTPFVQHVAKVNVQIQAYQTQAIESASADLQDVHTGVTVNFQIDPGRVVEVYTNFREDIVDRILRPNVQETVKAATAKFTAEQLITQRAAVKQLADTILAQRVEPFGLHIEATSITQFEFSPTFTQAIEAKVTAEQNALQAKNRLLQVEYEAKQKVAAAQGEAQALQLRRLQLNGAILQLEAIQKWDGRLPQFLAAGSAVPFINLNQATEKP